MQITSGGGLYLGTSCLSGRYWSGALSYFSEFKDCLDVEKRVAATKLDMGVSEMKLINDTSLLLATDSGGIHWWSLQEEEQQLSLVAEPLEHDDIVSTLDVSTDRKLAVSGGHDMKVIVWDTEEAIPTNTYRGHSGKVNAVACSPVESQIFLSCSQDGSVLMWDLRLSKPAKPIDISSTGSLPTALAWQPESDQCFAVGTESGLITLVDLRNTSQKSAVSCPHSRAVHRVLFNPAAPSHLASLAEDCKVVVTDFSKETPATRYSDSRHTDFPRGAFWRDSQLVTCGWDSQVLTHTLPLTNGT